MRHEGIRNESDSKEFYFVYVKGVKRKTDYALGVNTSDTKRSVEVNEENNVKIYIQMSNARCK